MRVIRDDKEEDLDYLELEIPSWPFTMASFMWNYSRKKTETDLTLKRIKEAS